MFKGLKNKIKEETGSDISKISPLLSNASQKVAFKGRHSRQGSTSSIGSISVDGIREENSQSPIPHENSVEEDSKLVLSKDVKLMEKRDEEWKKRLNKLEMEWKKKMEEKEREWKKLLEAKDNEKRSTEQSIEELQKALTSAEEFKTKYCRFQEEREQLEGFQTQEMAKIKHLLLAKERELTEKLNIIKDCNAQISTLKLEVARLRRFEEEISNAQDEMETLRHSSEQERSTLRSELAQSEENVRHLRDRVAVLERRTSADCVALGAPLSVDERVQGLLGERALLERRLEEAHLHLADIKSSWSSKITSLETQVGRLCRQAAEEGTERRRAEKECLQLEERIQQLELELVTANDRQLKSSSLAEEIEQLRNELEATTKEKKEVSVKLEETQTKLEAAFRDLQEELKTEQFKVAELQSKSEAEATDLRHQISELQNLMSVETETSKICVAQLQHELDVERLKCADLSAKLDHERNEKEASAHGCAEISKQIDLLKQQLETREIDVTSLRTCVCTLESSITSKDEEIIEMRHQKEEMMLQVLELQKERDTLIASCKQVQDFQETIADLESQLLEKNKNIKQLQQRLADMKKTLQKELNLHPGGFGESGSNGSAMGSTSEDTAAAVLAPSSSHQVSQRRLQQQAGATSSPDGYNDVNFQYLKHVLIKFLTSREYEAKHLTRAVATLLHFSPEEERLLRETLEWKMSWFGSRPSLGFGQTSKTIPPPS